MYRTARAHPPSCCQVSFLLTLHLAPDLTGTRCACLFPCLLFSLCTPAHIYTCTHIIHWLVLKSFPTIGRMWKLWFLLRLRVVEFCPMPPRIFYYPVTASLSRTMRFSRCFCTPYMYQHTGAGNILYDTKSSLWGLRWGISLPITVTRAAFEYFILKSDAEVRKYDVCRLAWGRQMWSLWERRSRLNLLCSYK